jgi:tetratricopeptide (TPR) repeat protein
MIHKIFSVALLLLMFATAYGQEKPAIQIIDQMLMRCEYQRVIDTCRKILEFDKLDSEIHYKLGLAYQNTLDDDLAFECFTNAYKMNPEDKTYSFMLAKTLYGKGKNKAAEQIFQKLYSVDSLNWTYASYLTGIFMQENRYDDAIMVYRRFVKKDSTNFRYLDKMGFAYLKKGDHKNATELYSTSLSINNRDLTAIKNLAYLFSANHQSDSAIAILTKGIGIDSTDLSLYSLRAQIYFSRNYTKRALDDYLVLLAAGDSAEINLKRVGIGYCNNFQPRVAIPFLLKALSKDSVDYETCSYLGDAYSRIDGQKSILYYQKVIKILYPIYKQIGLSYLLLAESYKNNAMFNDAIKTYLQSQEITDDPAEYMNVANIYDEQLADKKNAIYYYQSYLDAIKKTGGTFSGEYLNSIKDRIKYLKTGVVKP